MNKLNKKRGWAKAYISRTYDASQNIDKDTKEEFLSNRLKKLEENFQELVELSKNLYDFSEEPDFVDPVEDILEYEDKYFSAHANLLVALKGRQTSERMQIEQPIDTLASQQAAFLEKLNDQTSSNIHLPKIKVPTFSGSYQDWPSFRDLFSGAIDQKPGLTSIQKFHYLKSYLEGEALQLIKHLTLTDNNYVEAWDRLTQRYDRKPLIIRSLVQSFLTLPTCNAVNVNILRKIADGADEIIRGLNALNANERDPWLIHILRSKVDDETRKAWAEDGDAQSERTFEEFNKFLSRRCDALETCQSNTRSSYRRSAMANFAKAEGEKRELKCKQCQEEHTLVQCSTFKALPVSARRSFAKKHNLCFNCLKGSHQVNQCLSSFRCRLCHSLHHTLLHIANSNPKSGELHVSANSNGTSDANIPSSSIPAVPALSCTHSTENFTKVSQTLLPTVVVKTLDKWGNFIDCRLLLDTGSTVSFITESFVQLLGSSRTNARITVKGLSSLHVGTTHGKVKLKIHSCNSENRCDVDLFILPKLTTACPAQSVDFINSTWTHIRNLPLADPSFGVPGPINVIIGADQVWNILTGEQLHFGENMPVALNSIFGWVITGSHNSFENPQSEFLVNHAQLDIDALVRSFMEMDSLQPLTNTFDKSDPVERHFSSTFTRDNNGTYIVKYPFKPNMPPIAATLPQSLSRLNNLEVRFQRNPVLRKKYVEFLNEYLDLGHMEKIPPAQVNIPDSKCFYLAHHAVFKADSSTTKCRVVFDGSIKDASGISLNDRLDIGPPIQRDLFGVFLRFRQFRYVFSTDIEKMFRGIKVSAEHNDYQRIVWRSEPTSQIEHYRLVTVTYGLASSPFLAVRVLKQIAEDYKEDYPFASRILLNYAYVDDIVTGSDSVEELITLKNELTDLLSKANLNLRKWSSNCWPLLETLSSDVCEFNPIAIDSQTPESVVKILGIQWSPSKDKFLLNIKPTDSIRGSKVTKRIVLSETSKIFDPLGMLAPTTVFLKILFQETWCLGLDWDDPLPNHINERWSNYMKDLHSLSQLQIPRCISMPSHPIELHGFSDASSVACAAVIYSRVNIGGAYELRLIASKTRVAPLKPISIPRLELNAALLLTKLLTLVRDSLTIPISYTYCWTDSEIVIHWLSSPPRRWNTFVSNRTAEILERAPRQHWRHITSAENPADCASRGVLPSQLVQHKLWWTGPSWLSLPESAWPKNKTFKISSADENVLVEEKVKKVIAFCASDSSSILQILSEKISSWIRLTRIVAYCLRFIQNCKRGSTTISSAFLTSVELARARNLLFRCTQAIAFSSDLKRLQQSQPIEPRSSLIKLAPFIDKEGVLRVGGRIRHAHINFNIKFPILLPKGFNISQSIIRHIHESHMHPGVESTFVLVRQQFWIVGCRNMVRKIIFACKTCFMQRKVTNVQLMGDLPKMRVRPSRCFLHCGIDYAGPVTIKFSKGRNPKKGKAWFAIFVCMCTKALHIELVSDLTSEAFLAAFRRFSARRGTPTDIYSDNGTTFHGAKRMLNELQLMAVSQTYQKEIAESLSNEGINWHFIPPSAPHFAGIWETGIRSIKLHLRRVIGDSILTFEEYYTVLTQIESILNSRPLCNISDSDIDPLTPAHFLIGEPYTCVPEPSVLDININRLQHWRHLQAMVQGFWKRWHQEYLTSLQQRNKWQQAKSDIEEGAIVVMKEPNLPPSKWLLGRIVAVHRGEDGFVRVVTIKTKKGEYRRSVTKVAMLPIQNSRSGAAV